MPSTSWRKTRLLILTMLLEYAKAYQDVCMADTFNAQCDSGDVIVMETALYGRMDTTSCLQAGAENIGCSNDVLYLLDQWCSGKEDCEFMPLAELAKIKSQWCGDMISFLRADFSCLSVITRESSDCRSGSVLTLTQHEGFLASHLTDETGCGSPSAPWVIKTNPGQTINFNLLDFIGLNPGDPHGECITFGTLFEKSLGTNHSICGGLQRKHEIYISKSHVIEIQINTKRNTDGRFILHFQTIGCADLSPPAHAWYSRDGNQATIGCDATEKVWHLECEENRWKGVVGNCSVSTAREETHINEKEAVNLPSVTILILGAIIVSTVVLSLIILSVGCYHNRRYRRSHRVNKEQMTAMTIYRKSTEIATSHYRPVSTCSSCHGTLPLREKTRNQAPLEKSPDTAPGYAHIWERPLPDPHHKRAPSTGSEYLSPKNTDSARSNPPGGASDTQKASSLDEDNASSFYSPETGHKYYVLDQAQC